MQFNLLNKIKYNNIIKQWQETEIIENGEDEEPTIIIKDHKYQNLIKKIFYKKNNMIHLTIFNLSYHKIIESEE